MGPDSKTELNNKLAELKSAVEDLENAIDYSDWEQAHDCALDAENAATDAQTIINSIRDEEEEKESADDTEELEEDEEVE